MLSAALTDSGVAEMSTFPSTGALGLICEHLRQREDACTMAQ